jgi:hypothetical protein
MHARQIAVTPSSVTGTLSLFLTKRLIDEKSPKKLTRMVYTGTPRHVTFTSVIVRIPLSGAVESIATSPPFGPIAIENISGLTRFTANESPEEPVCIHLFRQNPVFNSLHLKSPVHVVPPLEKKKCVHLYRYRTVYSLSLVAGYTVVITNIFPQ